MQVTHRISSRKKNISYLNYSFIRNFELQKIQNHPPLGKKPYSARKNGLYYRRHVYREKETNMKHQIGSKRHIVPKFDTVKQTCYHGID
jgi:hypothetical protein